MLAKSSAARAILVRFTFFPSLAVSLALAVVLWTGRSSAQTTPPPVTSLKGVRVAITVDDLPTHGDPFPGIDRDAISKAILSALANNSVKGAWGFTNEAWDEKEMDILREWLTAGYPLGNHTFSHLDLDNVDVHTYTSDIAHQDLILGSLVSFSPLIAKRKMFRYPFLAEGSSLTKRNEVRQYLFSEGYRIAEVTTDYLDWTWTDAYRRCLIHHDEKSIDWLRAHVNDAADRYLRLSVEMARKLFHRDIDQILLIHIGAFDALTLDGILREWRSKGVKLIPLEEALKDPVYKINPNLPNEGGLSFLEQIAEARNFDTRPFVETTYTIESLKRVCEQPSAAH